MSIEEDETRKKIAKLLDAGTVRPDVLQMEAMLKNQSATGGRGAEGRDCACWRGTLCRFHNLMYHGKV